MKTKDFKIVLEKPKNEETRMQLSEKDLVQDAKKVFTVLWAYMDEEGEPYTGTSIVNAEDETAAKKIVKSYHPKVTSMNVKPGRLGYDYEELWHEKREIDDAAAYKNYGYDFGLRIEVDKESFDKLAAQYETDKEDHTAFNYVNAFNATANKLKSEFDIAYHTNLSAKSENRMIKADRDPVVIASASRVLLEFENAEFPAVAKEKIRHLYDDIIDELNGWDVKYEVRYIRDFKTRYVSEEEDKPLEDSEPEDLAEQAMDYLAEDSKNVVEFDGGRVWIENDGDRWVAHEDDGTSAEEVIQLKAREDLKRALTKYINLETEGRDDFEYCTWCNELFPQSDMVKERDLGWLCNRCAAAIRSRGEKLTIEDGAKHIERNLSPEQYKAMGWEPITKEYRLNEVLPENVLNQLREDLRLLTHVQLDNVTDEEKEFVAFVAKKYQSEGGKKSEWYKFMQKEAERNGFRPLDDLLKWHLTKISNKNAELGFDTKSGNPLNIPVKLTAYYGYDHGVPEVHKTSFEFPREAYMARLAEAQAKDRNANSNYNEKSLGQFVTVVGDAVFNAVKEELLKEITPLLEAKKPAEKKESLTQSETDKKFLEIYGSDDVETNNLLLQWRHDPTALSPEDKAKIDELVRTKNEERAEEDKKIKLLVAKSLKEALIGLGVLAPNGVPIIGDYKGIDGYMDFVGAVDATVRGKDDSKFQAGAERFSEEIEKRLKESNESDDDLLADL